MTKILIGRGDTDLDYPVCRPSLDLDFTHEELDPRITFTRGSIGTRVNRNRVIETVDANQPRFDYDPISGECRGLLIEESRQNLLTYSEDFSDASWNKSDISVSTNQITSPDGNLTADKIIIGTGVNVSHIITQTFSTITAGSTITFSVFAKYNDWSSIRIQVFGNAITADTFQARFNIQTGTFISSGSGGSATLVSQSITSFPNGWYRCSVTGIVNNTDTSVRTRVAFMNTSGSTIFTGDGVSSYYIWGAQVEAGAFPTSYIPTTTSTVTRSTDLASMTGTNFSSWYNQNEGTFLFDGTLPFITNDSINRVPYGVSNGFNFANSMYVSKGSTSLGVGFSVVDGNVGQSSGSTGGTMTSDRFKIASAVAPKSIRTSFSGGIVNPSRPSATIPTVDRLTLGREPWNGSPFNPIIGCVKRFTYYPRALKPNQLQYLTQ